MDNGDGTVTDGLTGLMWTEDANAPGPVGCTPGVAKQWQEGLDYVACLNTNSYLGYNDWRLSNIKELRSLVNYEVSPQGWLGGEGFTNVQVNYWSSTTYADIPVGAQQIELLTGRLTGITKTPGNFSVWPVRAGQ